MTARLCRSLNALPLRMMTLLVREEGQDLVEYALLVALLSLCAVASMRTVASDISNAFSTVATKFQGNF